MKTQIRHLNSVLYTPS